VSPLTPDDLAAVALSLKVAGTATLASLPVAFAVALLLARGRFPGRSLLDALVHLPLVLPPVATGYVLLILLGRNGPLGRPLAEIGVVFAFDRTGAGLARPGVALPPVGRPVRLALLRPDPRGGGVPQRR